MPPLITRSGFTPKNAGDHSTRSASLPTAIEPISLAKSLRDGRIDGVFGDVAFDPSIVVTFGIAGQCAALGLHLVRGLPGADDDLADPAHRLAVGGHHRKRAEVVQDVLGGDGFLADAAFRERDVLGDRAVQVMADHQHVQMFVQRIGRVGPRGVGGAGQHVGAGRRP